ncbi:uncharacterized protein LOC135083193 isoform X3 [Ostrinia nubilalis]|uniref:uncharacterized protein LOC135083193 isoform X3 n=1 Tax=Ostrinia nubilalis TaxID=29057 RepID=UPI0030824A4E
MHIIMNAMFLIFIAKLVMNVELKDTDEYSDPKQEQVVVRAVFINCETNEDQNFLENQATRFQREELYKHSALQGCLKKLALTVKVTSEPGKSTGDEYIPIEHVFDGSNKRRARLLDPYILRLRRDPPVQAYKLRRIDTVSGILTLTSDRGTGKLKKSRVQRNLDELADQKEWRQHFENTERQNVMADSEVEERQDSKQCLIPENAANLTGQMTSLTSKASANLNTLFSVKHANEFSKNQIGLAIQDHTRVKRDSCTLANNPAWKRDKRHEHNIIVEDITDDYKIPWVEKDRFYRRLEQPASGADTLDKKSSTHNVEDDNYMKSAPNTEPHTHRASHVQNELHQLSSKREKPEDRSSRNENHRKSTAKIRENRDKPYNFLDHTTHKNFDKRTKNTNKMSRVNAPEKNFVLYDIGSPDLWNSVHVQLFEKMSTPEGKTVWNDITKGEVASVSSVQPEWMDQDINVKYKPSEWISKDEFTLPTSAELCLLVPMRDEGSTDVGDDNMITDLNTVGKYIVLHKNDIIDVDGAKNMLSKRDGNYSDFTSMPESNGRNEQGHRRVLVRVSRALLSGNEEDLKVSSLGSEHFLTLPHRHPHHAQIDLEARADENQLIRVGSSGSINTIVADNSRRTRSLITVQATNKGLAAARFRVKARDCGPEMASLLNQKESELVAGPTLLPPRHTQRFHLELPTELPVDVVHCSDEDPKLVCREMADARQVAAGLSPRERSRRARSVCYPDVVSLNLFVVAVGVLMALLLLGLAKACLGLFCRCVAKWGLDKLIQMPRKLDHYYEPGLSGRCVVYDDEGWPVHPDTKRRSVRLVPKLVEFILNIIFFITVPCIMLRDAVTQLLCRSSPRQCGAAPDGRDDQKCFSTHDMQGLQQRWRRRRGGLRRWMTPQAEDLSTDIWSKGLATRKSVECEFMRPLLHERHHRTGEIVSSCVDSEQDDTEYVLRQMQKSKESLARSQKKLNESGPSSARKPLNTENKLSRTIIRQN